MRQDISGWTLRLDEADIGRNRGTGIWRRRTIAQDARHLAQTEPDAVCCIAGDQQYRFGPLAIQAEALAASLWDMGLRPGDVLSFQLPNWPEAIVVNLAASIIGIVVNPIVPICRNAEVGTILRDCRAKTIVVPGRFRGVDYPAMLARLRPSLPELRHMIIVRAGGSDGFEALIEAGRGKSVPWQEQRPESVTLIMYTSGTTGRPKGVLHTHETTPRDPGLL